MLGRMEAIARFARTHMVIRGNYLRSLSGYLPTFPQSLLYGMISMLIVISADLLNLLVTSSRRSALSIDSVVFALYFPLLHERVGAKVVTGVRTLLILLSPSSHVMVVLRVQTETRQRVSDFLENTTAYCAKDRDTFGERLPLEGAVAEQNKRKWEDFIDEPGKAVSRKKRVKIAAEERSDRRGSFE